MATTTEIQLLVTAKDQASNTLKKVGSSMEGVAKVGKTIASGLAIAGVGAVAFGVKAVRAFSESEEVSKKLEKIVLNLKGATMENVDALNRQADALKKVGVLDDETIKSAQAQLATFDLQSKSIEQVIPGLLDMIVAEKGMNATMDDAKMAAQGLGKAFQGNFEVLSKQGFVITDTQKKMIELGTEEQKVQAITEILGNTYNGVNETMAKTNSGQLLKAQQAFGDLEKSIGGVISNALTPFIPKITEAINSISQEKIQSAQKYFEAFGNAVVFTVGVIGKVMKTLTAVFEAVFYAMFRGIDIAKGAWSGFKDSIKGIADSIIGFFKPVLEFINKMISSYNKLADKIGKDTLPEMKMPGKALGGSVRAGEAYIVGEHRPEIFIPSQGGTIKPSVTSQGGSGMTVNIYNPPSNMDVRGVIEEVERALNRKQELTRLGAI